MLVADHEDARARLLDLRPFGGVDHALDGAVDDDLALLHGLDRRPVALDGKGGARRLDGNRRRLARRRHGDHAVVGAKIVAGKVGKLHQHGPRLRLRNDGHARSAAYAIKHEYPSEAGKPLPFNALLQH